MKCASEFSEAHVFEKGKFHLTIAEQSFHDANHFMHASAFHHLGVFMSENLILDLSMQFEIDVVNLCDSLKGKSVLTNQLLHKIKSFTHHKRIFVRDVSKFIKNGHVFLKDPF